MSGNPFHQSEAAKRLKGQRAVNHKGNERAGKETMVHWHEYSEKADVESRCSATNEARSGQGTQYTPQSEIFCLGNPLYPLYLKNYEIFQLLYFSTLLIL